MVSRNFDILFFISFLKLEVSTPWLFYSFFKANFDFMSNFIYSTFQLGYGTGTGYVYCTVLGHNKNSPRNVEYSKISKLKALTN
jgi:hypothetical protein